MKVSPALAPWQSALMSGEELLEELLLLSRWLVVVDEVVEYSGSSVPRPAPQRLVLVVVLGHSFHSLSSLLGVCGEVTGVG